MPKHLTVLLVTIIFLVGAFLRLNRFPIRLIYGPEQGISFMTSAANLTKFSLLGETNLQRATTDAHIPFHGAYYSYLLLPIILASNFQVLPISLFFVLLNLVTAYVFFIIIKKIFGLPVALLSLFYFVFSPIMIHHSLFAWILNPLPLVGSLTIYLLATLIRNRQASTSVFWLGLLSGFGFGLQNLYLPFGVVVLLFTVAVSKTPLRAAAIFFFGAIIGNLPMVIFDLRHNLYHLRTLWQYFLDVLSHNISGFTDYYHFLHLFPALFLFYAVITLLLYRIYKPLAILCLGGYLYLCFSSPLFSLNTSTGMATGMSLSTLERAATAIAASYPPARFNIATLWDFDTRANTLRYLLQYNHGLHPLPYEEYQHLDALYVFAPKDYNILSPQVWELQVFAPYTSTIIYTDASGYILYKLHK